MPDNNNKKLDVFAKYGATTVLLIVVLFIGVILYIWGKSEKGKAWAEYSGLSMMITGGVVGLGAIIHSFVTTPQTTTNNNTTNDNLSGDSLPD